MGIKTISSRLKRGKLKVALGAIASVFFVSGCQSYCVDVLYTSPVMLNNWGLGTEVRLAGVKQHNRVIGLIPPGRYYLPESQTNKSGLTFIAKKDAIKGYLSWDPNRVDLCEDRKSRENIDTLIILGTDGFDSVRWKDFDNPYEQ